MQSISAKCISIITSYPEGQVYFINEKKGALKSLHSLLLSSNDVVQKYASKTIAFLSMHSEQARAKVLHEDMAMGGALVSVLCACTNLHTLSHCACAVANLASTLESQLLIPPEMIRSLCILVVDHPTIDEMQVHVARGLANFALFERNHDVLLDVLHNMLLLLLSPSREVCIRIFHKNIIYIYIREKNKYGKRSQLFIYTYTFVFYLFPPCTTTSLGPPTYFKSH